jgi:hypothetical protein
MPVNGLPSLIHKKQEGILMPFKITPKVQHFDWYREANPAKLDLADVNDSYSNPLIGLISVMFKAPAETSFRMCIAEVMLIGAIIHVDVFASRRGNNTFYLAIPQGVELSKKIQAQILRCWERYEKDTFGK